MHDQLVMHRWPTVELIAGISIQAVIDSGLENSASCLETFHYH